MILTFTASPFSNAEDLGEERPPQKSSKRRGIPFPRKDLTLGVNYRFPMVAQQFATSSTLALGAMVFLVSWPTTDNTVRRGWTALLTFNLYPSRVFHGPWVHGGAGLSITQGGIPNQSFSTLVTPAGILALGWRWSLGAGVNFGAAVGMNGVLRASNDGKSGRRLIPALILDLGSVH